MVVVKDELKKTFVLTIIFRVRYLRAEKYWYKEKVSVFYSRINLLEYCRRTYVQVSVDTRVMGGINRRIMLDRVMQDG